MEKSTQEPIKKLNNQENSKIDARIISFNPFGLSNDKSSDVFSYFTQTIIEGKGENKCHELQKAYENAMSLDCTNKDGNRFLIAFTDMKTIDDESKLGYTQEQINELWECDKSPLLFLTMINLTRSNDIKKGIKQIKKIFQGSNYLIYFTFDHCDLLIFCRKDSFEDYGRMIKKMAFENDVIANVYSFFQLYNFNNLEESDGKKFHALIRLKVDSEVQINELWNSINNTDFVNIKKQVFFDHFNCGFYCQNADLSWLLSITDTIKKYEHELLISVDYKSEKGTLISNSKSNGSDDPNGDERKGKNKLLNNALNVFDKFSDLYSKVYQKYELTSPQNNNSSINVWLRWLKSSLRYSVSLMNNPTSRDIGTCLVPQYLDLLEYGIKFYSKLYNEDGNCDNIEMMTQSMFEFFSDIAILVDSMNCGYRQFAQTPSYHLPSFEVPPKIMEYYIAVAHELMLLFREDDDKETIYSILITPQFINHLGVISIADQRVLENDQWLEIVIGESSFYTLQLTTQTLGHEISHFVGQKTRCRDKRKEYVLEYAYCLLINTIFDKIFSNLEIEKFIDVLDLESFQISIKEFIPKHVFKTAEKMFQIAKQIVNGYSPETQNRMINLESYIYLLANNVLNNPSIFQIMSDFLIKSLNIPHSNSFVQRSIKMSIDEQLRSELTEYTNTYSNDVLIKGDDSRFNSLKSEYKLALDFFKETFADLQAIMTFNMTWEQYCKLISRGDEKAVPKDCYLRMLAVAKTLSYNKEPSWENIAETLKDNSPGCNSVFEKIEKAIKYSPTENVEELQLMGFNATLLYYLTKYLNECYRYIRAELKSKRCANRRKRLQKMHKTLENSTALEVQTQISSFVEEYRNSLYSRFAELANPEGSVFNL